MFLSRSWPSSVVQQDRLREILARELCEVVWRARSSRLVVGETYAVDSVSGSADVSAANVHESAVPHPNSVSDVRIFASGGSSSTGSGGPGNGGVRVAFVLHEGETVTAYHNEKSALALLINLQ